MPDPGLGDSCPFSLKDEIALVTGGGTGLGFAMSTALLAAGAKVILSGRRPEVLQEAVRQLGSRAFSYTQDVTSAQSIADSMGLMQQQVGDPTILINNAGTHLKKPLLDTSMSEFRGVLSTHVEGALMLSQAVVPGMRKRGSGSILFIASMTSLIGMPNVVAYSAAKSALLGMVRSLATELGPGNIRVNGIAPGWVQTPMLNKALEGDPGRKDKILARTPQTKFGDPMDIGWAAVYLSSPAASFVNGVVLPVDGGASIGF